MKHFSTLFQLCLYLLVCYSTIAQKVTISGQATVGRPIENDTLLKFNTERPWFFRQIDTGPSAALELNSTIGLKNFIITTTGNVGIDVKTPLEKLQVNGNIKATGPKVAFGSSEYINDAGSFLIECNGTLESTLDNTDFLGTSSRRWNSVYAVNGTINTSDLRSKTNIQPLTYGLNTIMQLRPVSFEWIDNPTGGNKLGLIAQEVQKLIPEVVVDYDLERDESTGKMIKKPAQQLGMYYADLLPVLIKAIQEQQQIIIEKDQELTILKQKLQSIQTRLANIEAALSLSQP